MQSCGTCICSGLDKNVKAGRKIKNVWWHLTLLDLFWCVNLLKCVYDCVCISDIRQLCTTVSTRTSSSYSWATCRACWFMFTLRLSFLTIVYIFTWWLHICLSLPVQWKTLWKMTCRVLCVTFSSAYSVFFGRLTYYTECNTPHSKSKWWHCLMCRLQKSQTVIASETFLYCH